MLLWSWFQKCVQSYEVMKIYNQGHRIFAENRVQIITEISGYAQKDIQWHLIEDTSKNKVKYLAPLFN